jgi:hypothetical protein
MSTFRIQSLNILIKGIDKKIQEKIFPTISESNQMYMGGNYIPSANFCYQSRIFIPSGGREISW